MNGNTYKSVIQPLVNAGISESDALKLRRIAMTLHRWHELECGDGNDYASWSIERDEETDKPYMVEYPHRESKPRRHLIPDREKGALKRLAAIMARYPSLRYYVQGDPRGAALYVIRPGDIRGSLDSSYNNGIAIYR